MTKMKLFLKRLLYQIAVRTLDSVQQAIEKTSSENVRQIGKHPSCACISCQIKKKTIRYFLLQNQNQQRVRRRLPVGSNSKFHEIIVLLDGDRGIVELEVNGITVSCTSEVTPVFELFAKKKL